MPKVKFKYFSQEFCGKQLELVKQKRLCLYEHINAFENFDETNLFKRGDFYSLLWDEHAIKIDDGDAKKFEMNFKLRKREVIMIGFSPFLNKNRCNFFSRCIWKI